MPGSPTPRLGPVHRRLLAEELVRLRRPDEQRRYASCQRQGRIDPNPHQIDAVVFALRRIPEGGCILADEVGLGKTIEAGLVLSQLMAEGMRRVLLIVPKSLLGQWQTELYTLFGIETREGAIDPEAFTGTGVFLTHRDLAGGSKGASVLKAVDPFDLVVVDEAHEVFAGLYKRYDREGSYEEASKEALIAGRVQELVKRGNTPVLMLTATPIQNSLAELWGLVQYVEPTGTLLGRLPTFREVFCDGGDRTLVPAQAAELRRRLQTVLQRTLRRQAQDFLEVPFVERRSRLFEYTMSPDEKSLYDDVTSWLMKPDLCAFRGSQRALLLIGFHRRMASSLAALSASLQRVANRLREQLVNSGHGTATSEAMVDEFARDLEDEVSTPASDSTPSPPPSVERVREELQVVEGFAARAEGLPADSKARSLIEALRIIRELRDRGEGTGKAIVFTESITTQEYLRRLLLDNGYRSGDVTLFRGDNDTPEARAALVRWHEEVGASIPAAHLPSRDVALRLALVREFAERSSVFISTEAGAKGLNLQFCETVINYDLPWNPQRIEQRIGRVHRYGQRRGVTVVSFLARDNEAQRLTFEILSQKLDLFGRVLDASDAVLHDPAHKAPESLVSGVAIDFETQLRRIYEQARSIDDVADELRHLRDAMEAKRREFDDEQRRASTLVESRLDESVRQVFRNYRNALPAELIDLDDDMDRLLRGYLEAVGVGYERTHIPGRVEYRISASPVLPPDYREGALVVIGDSRDMREGDLLHLGHSLVHAAIQEARDATSAPLDVELVAPSPDFTKSLGPLRGRAGRMVVTRIAYRGIEPHDRLITTVVLDGDDAPLAGPMVDALLALDTRPVRVPVAVDADPLDEAEEEAVFIDQSEVAAREQPRYQQMLQQLDRYVEDQVLVLRRRTARLEERIDDTQRRRDRSLNAAMRAKDDAAIGSLRDEIARADERLAVLESGVDDEYQAWRQRLLDRRFRKPEVTRMLDVRFRVADGGTAC